MKWRASGALAGALIPNTLEAVLNQRINSLKKKEREMLSIGSVQGDIFMSSILAELISKKEVDVLSRLRLIVEKHQIIRYYFSDDWNEKSSDIYIFEHHFMQQAFYNKLGKGNVFSIIMILLNF